MARKVGQQDTRSTRHCRPSAIPHTAPPARHTVSWQREELVGGRRRPIAHLGHVARPPDTRQLALETRTRSAGQLSPACRKSRRRTLQRTLPVDETLAARRRPADRHSWWRNAPAQQLTTYTAGADADVTRASADLHGEGCSKSALQGAGAAGLGACPSARLSQTVVPHCHRGQMYDLDVSQISRAIDPIETGVLRALAT
jgi:hypothetical protein